MKKILVFGAIIFISLFGFSKSFADTITLSETEKSMIDTLLDTKIFPKYSEEKLTSIKGVLQTVDVEAFKENEQKYNLIKYLIFAFNERYDKQIMLEKVSVSILPTDTDILDIFMLVNKERKSAEKGELSYSNFLEKIAYEHAKNMSENNFYSHTLPDGTTFMERIIATGYTGFIAGENLGEGFTQTDELVEAWMESDTHKANILKDEFTETGIAHYGKYWVQTFGGRK